MTGQVLSVPALEWTSDTEAAVNPADSIGEEELGLLLLRAVRAFASQAAGGASVHPVSITLDTTARLDAEAPITFTTALDRRTRTLVFANGTAHAGNAGVMTATAVYRID
ncbi:MAG: hypothetical protein AAF253_10380 [Pseudomonadota bacterium]